MRVQRVRVAGARGESWTVLGEDGWPVEPVERFLAYLSSIERSPNTVKAYAHDLKDWFVFLNRRDLDWRAVQVEDVAAFVAWLRLPPMARDGRVTVLPTVDHHCSESSVNRKLAAVGVQHLARDVEDQREQRHPHRDPVVGLTEDRQGGVCVQVVGTKRRRGEKTVPPGRKAANITVASLCAIGEGCGSV